MNRHVTRRIRKLLGDTRGSIAVEFALVAPVLMIMLAGVIDVGSAAYARLSLQSRVTTAGEFALMADLDADALAESAMGLLRGRASETAEVVVNNAAKAKWDGSEVTTQSLSGDAMACYCPTRSDGQIEWGSSVGCETSCDTSGDSAGRFVQISATADHVSIFPGYAFIDGDMVRASAVLRLN
ncbi:MAG: TadE/TadG family type IV pilus assembly protein [Roseovarius sp.]